LTAARRPRYNYLFHAGARWRGEPVQVVVNDRPQSVDEGITVSQLLDNLHLTGKHVAVEVNLELVPRQRHAEHHLAEGDRLEIVTLVGGG